jgi:hypothetical protein
VRCDDRLVTAERLEPAVVVFGTKAGKFYKLSAKQGA